MVVFLETAREYSLFRNGLTVVVLDEKKTGQYLFIEKAWH